MTSKAFLKERLFQVFNSIKNLNIRYQFNKKGNFHMVEISPPCEYLVTSELMVVQTKLLYDFKQKFMSEKLIFVDGNSSVFLESPEFSFSWAKGKSVIETRSVKQFSPSFTLMVTNDIPNYRSVQM